MQETNWHEIYKTLGIVLVGCFLLFLFKNTNYPKIIKTKKEVIFTPVKTKENNRLEKEVIPFEKKEEEKVENTTQFKNINNTVKSDSITKTEIPKAVIIKKQIIKKDTVYVEKK